MKSSLPIKNKRILITSPSLDVKDNISGISTLVSNIITHSELDFIHFELGSKDGIKKNLGWALSQFKVFLKMIFVAVFSKFEYVHLNLGLEKLSIIRDSIFFIVLKHVFRKKVVLHIHGGYYLMHESGNKLLRFLMRHDFRNADAVIVLSDLEKEIVRKRYGDLSIHVLPNSVNTTAHRGRTRSGKGGNIRFVFMGRIVSAKGIFTISESLQYLTAYFSRFSFTIYGTGPDLGKWLDQLSRYPSLNFSYKGILGEEEKWNALSDCDVFLLPSLHGEGLPIAMLEAMAVGCAVVVTDVASVKTVVSDNINGFLLSNSCPKLLADKMKEIVEGEVNLDPIGQNARLYIENHLSLSDYIKKVERFYSAL